MASILIIDSDKEDTKSLQAALREKGHSVETSSKGRAGIDRGMQMRPDILITEWWLRELPGGLRISGALRAVCPEMHSILVTRYATADVRQAAQEAGFFGLLPKPADPEKLLEAVAKAAETPPLPTAETVAFVEYDPSSRITYANPEARRLLHLPMTGEIPNRLTGIFGHRNLKALESQRADWVEVTSMTSPPFKVEILTMHADGGRTRALLLPDGAEKRKAGPATLLLIDAGTLTIRSQAFRKPQQRVLVIDEDRLQRRFLSHQFEGLGIQFHSTDSPDQGLQLLDADPEIGAVIIDYSLKDDGAGPAIQRILDIRPEIRVIGTSTAFRKVEFTKLGANGFLPKPATPDAIRTALGC